MQDEDAEQKGSSQAGADSEKENTSAPASKRAIKKNEPKVQKPIQTTLPTRRSSRRG
jgi:hypothetical protein